MCESRFRRNAQNNSLNAKPVKAESLKISKAEIDFWCIVRSRQKSVEAIIKAAITLLNGDSDLRGHVAS